MKQSTQTTITSAKPSQNQTSLINENIITLFKTVSKDNVKENDSIKTTTNTAFC